LFRTKRVFAVENFIFVLYIWQFGKSCRRTLRHVSLHWQQCTAHARSPLHFKKLQK